LLSQRIPIALIALYVLLEFLAPEIGSSLGRGASSASFMSVPETAVNEDHQAILSKHNIRRARHVATMNTKAEPQAMRGSTHDHFRHRVLPPNAPHECGPR
jgi:hypothetical protein